MPTSPHEFQGYLDAPEGNQFESKEAKGGFHFDKLVEYVVAILNCSDQQTLADAELALDGQLTFAALILFGTRAALGRHLAQAEVVFEYRSKEAAGPAQDRQEHREGFFLFHDRLWERINLRNDKQSYQDGFFRFDIPTFDEKIVREATLNAVCHRDYRLGGSVFVRQFARRLEVISPGGLAEPQPVGKHFWLALLRLAGRSMALGQ